MFALLSRAVSAVSTFADVVTKFSATPGFLVLHVVWFAAWLSTGAFGVDPYPFGFLTLVVSLEAIFLSLLILSSQARQAEREQAKVDKEREEIDEDHELLKLIAAELGVISVE